MSKIWEAFEKQGLAYPYDFVADPSLIENEENFTSAVTVLVAPIS